MRILEAFNCYKSPIVWHNRPKQALLTTLEKKTVRLPEGKRTAHPEPTIHRIRMLYGHWATGCGFRPQPKGFGQCS